MVSSNSQLGVTLVARDQLSPTLKKVEQHTRNLDKAFGSFGARMKTAFQFHVVNRGLTLMEQGLRKVANALPDLIARGEKWAATVDAIADATGMSARQASELAAVQMRVGGSSEMLATRLSAMARTVTDNADHWRDLGVRIVRTRAGSVDAYATFQNLRRGISATGDSMLSTAAAQKLLGRGSKDLLDLLRLTDRQFRELAADARRSGLILTEAGLAAAEQWGRTRVRLDQAITGIGAQLLNALAPTFIGLTNGITDLIQKNLGQIVRFVSGAVSFVAGMVSQFLGIEFNVDLPEKIEDVGRAADTTGKQLTKGAKGTKDATAANRDLSASAKELREAERALAAAQSERIFGANMSVADMILANQAKQARIKDAEERVRDARKSAREHGKTMDTIVKQNDLAIGDIRRKWRANSGDNSPIVTGLKETLASSKAFGKQIADTIQDAIFGPDQQIQLGGGAPISIRSGGLVGALQDAGTLMGTVGGHLSNLNSLLSGNLPALIAGMVGLNLALGLVPGAGAAVTGGVGAAIGAIGGAPTVAAIAAAMVPALWYAAAGGKYRPDRVAGAPGTNISSDRPQGPPNVHGTAASRARHARWALLQRAAQQSSPWLHRDPAEPWIPASPAEGPMPGPAPGAGIGNLAATSGLDAYGTLMDNIYRRYSGDGSMMLEAASSTASSLTSLVVSVPEALDSLVANQNLATQDIGAMWASIGEQGLELRDMGNKATAALESAQMANTAAAIAQANANAALGVGQAAQSSANSAYGVATAALGNAATAQSSANSAYGVGVSALGNAATAQAYADYGIGLASAAQSTASAAYSTASSAYGVGVSALANAATAQGTANYGVAIGSAAQSTATEAYNVGASAYGLATSALANAATAQGYANYGIGLASAAQSTAGYGVNLANTAQAYADYGIGLANAAQATASAGYNAAGSAQGTANYAVDRAANAKNRAEDANQYAAAAYSRADGAHSRLDNMSGHIDRLWNTVWGKLEINSFKAFKGAQKVLDGVQNRRLNALEGSQNKAGKDEAASAMSAVSSADGGLARGGYAPPGWVGWVGEEGPELMRMGSRGATVTDAQKSARMAGVPIVVNIQMDGRTIARAMTSSDVATSTLKPG